MKRKFVSKIAFLLALSHAVCLSACDRTECDSEKLPVHEPAHSKDGAHGASAQGDKNGQKGSMGLNGGHSGNGGDSEWGKGGDGGQGGDVD